MAKAEIPKSGPAERFSRDYDNHVDCPWCGGGNTRISSPFGGTVSEILFTCSDCGETFGWMKWEHRRGDAGPEPGDGK